MLVVMHIIITFTCCPRRDHRNWAIGAVLTWCRFVLRLCRRGLVRFRHAPSKSKHASPHALRGGRVLQLVFSASKRQTQIPDVASGLSRSWANVSASIATVMTMRAKFSL